MRDNYLLSAGRDIKNYEAQYLSRAPFNFLIISYFDSLKKLRNSFNFLMAGLNFLQLIVKMEHFREMIICKTYFYSRIT